MLEKSSINLILCAVLTVFNLFTGVIVSAIEEDHEKDLEEHQKNTRIKASVIMTEIRKLRQEVAELKANRKIPE